MKVKKVTEIKAMTLSEVESCDESIETLTTQSSQIKGNLEKIVLDEEVAVCWSNKLISFVK